MLPNSSMLVCDIQTAEINRANSLKSGGWESCAGDEGLVRESTKQKEKREND